MSRDHLPGCRPASVAGDGSAHQIRSPCSIWRLVGRSLPDPPDLAGVALPRPGLDDRGVVLPGGGGVGRSSCFDRMCAVDGCRGGGLGRCGRCCLFGGRRSWVLVVRDFGHAGGEVSVDVYYSGSGCPVYYSGSGCPVTRFDEVQRLLRLRALPRPGLWPGGWDGGGTGGNPWPSAEATTMAAPLLGVGPLLGGLVEVLSHLSL